MAGIQLSGLASGLDTATIIDQLMSIEKQPRTKITLQQDATTQRQSLLQDISTKLTSLKLANDDLKSIGTWVDTQTVESGDTTKLTATRTGGAAPGGFDVSISQLATAARATYTYASPAADGPFTVLNADGTTRASIDLKAGASIDDAVAAINGSSDAKLYAVNVNGDLVLSAKTTGDSSGFSVAGIGSQASHVDGLNAKLNISGIDYERQSNTISDALPGITLNLRSKTATGATVGLSVGAPGPDVNAVTTKVKAFVDAYNALVTAARADLSEQRVPNAATTADVQKGTLFGDSGLQSMLSSFRATISAPIPGMSGTLTSLADLGISTGAANSGSTINQDSVDGKLTIDTDKLTAALTTDPLAVRKLLGGVAGTDGFSQAFKNVIAPLQGSTGQFATRITSAATELTGLNSRLDDFDARMEIKQAYYQKQFTALETAMSQSQSVGASLTSFISSSPA